MTSQPTRRLSLNGLVGASLAVQESRRPKIIFQLTDGQRALDRFQSTGGGRNSPEGRPAVRMRERRRFRVHGAVVNFAQSGTDPQGGSPATHLISD